MAGQKACDSFLNADDVPENEPLIRDIHFPVMCKIAFYPMRTGDFKSRSKEQTRTAQEVLSDVRSGFG